MILVYLVAAWITGIALATWRPALGGLWPIAAIGGLIVAVLLRRDSGRRLAGLCLLMAGLGLWRTQSAQPVFTAKDAATYNDRGYAYMIGIVADAPVVKDKTMQLRVEIRYIWQGKGSHNVHGLALVDADRYANINYGDRITIRGQPMTPPVFDSFSYRDYLAQSGIYTFIPRSRITVVQHNQGSPILGALFDVRERAHKLINQILPEPQSGLLSGILLGISKDLPPEVTDAFNQTGTSHIISSSGLKIAVVAGLLFVLFGRLGNKPLAALGIIAGIGIYTVFVGATDSVVRAAIMTTLAILAERLGRRRDGLTALAFAVLVITLINPGAILDAGLLLGASATVGLILYTEPLNRLAEGAVARLFKGDKDDLIRRALKIASDTIMVTVAAQIGSLPFVFLLFGQFSPISVIVNALVFPLQGTIMILGIVAVISGAIWLPIGQIVAWLAGIGLAYTLAIVRATAQLPGASVSVSPDPAFAIGYYGVLFAVTVYLSQRAETRQTWLNRVRQVATTPVLAVLGVGMAILVWTVAMAHPDGKLHVWFLAVGKGNAVLIQSPRGAHILIDGGENPTELQTAIGDRLPFFVRDLDLLLVTQPAPTTITAIPALFDHYNVKSALTTGQSAAKDPNYQALENALSADHTQVVEAVAGYTASTDDGLTLTVLNPDQVPTDPKTKPADAAMIVRLTYGKSTFLLTSNLSEKGVQAILATKQYLGARVLELPSNGAEKENPDELIKAVSPEVGIIEAEQGNAAAEPPDTVLKRLGSIRVFRTDLQGTIEVATDGDSLQINTAKTTS